MATLHTAIPPQAYGEVRDLTIRQFGSKTMLHLQPPGESASCTMILCHRNETMLSELKVRGSEACVETVVLAPGVSLLSVNMINNKWPHKARLVECFTSKAGGRDSTLLQHF